MVFPTVSNAVQNSSPWSVIFNHRLCDPHDVRRIAPVGATRLTATTVGKFKALRTAEGTFKDSNEGKFQSGEYLFLGGFKQMKKQSINSFDVVASGMLCRCREHPFP
jgi:hypothetical protein